MTGVTFTAVNKAIGTDAADMPHVLGDPADAAWKGTAERVNDNFAALSTYASSQIAAMNAMRVLSAELSGTNVIVPNTGWAITAYARTLSFAGGKLVFLNIYTATYSGTGYWDSAALARPGGLYSTPRPVIGTLVAALRPAMPLYLWRPVGASFMKSTSPDLVLQVYAGAHLDIATNGAVTLTHSSASYNAWWEKTGHAQFDYVYYTGA